MGIWVWSCGGIRPEARLELGHARSVLHLVQVVPKAAKIFIHDVLEGIFMGHFPDEMTLNKWTLRWFLKAVGIFKPWHKYGRKSLTGFT